MRRDGTTWGRLGLSLALALTSACGLDTDPIASVKGRISDDDGYQTLRFGGDGTTAAATTIRALAVGNGGTLASLSRSELDAEGRFHFDVPAEHTRLLLEAIDERGEVVAAAILEHSGAEGETVTSTPLTSESSLEAALFLVMATRASSVEDVNVVDLRARVTARMAVALREKEAAGEDVQADVLRIAEALLAAQATEVRAYAGLGVEISQAELFSHELAASQALSAALDEGSDPAAAYEAFYEALDDVAASLGLSAEARARAESSAGLAFRIVIDERVRANTVAAREVTDSAVLAAARAEGHAYERATLALLERPDVDERLRDEAADAADALRANLTLASNASRAAEAFRALKTTLVGDVTLGTSLLGGLLRLDATAAIGVEDALAESAEASSDLDQALKRLAQRTLAAPGDIDVDAFAIEVTRAYSAHHAALLRASENIVLAADPDPALAVGLVVLAETAYRLGE